MEKLKNFYTATDDQQALTVRNLIEILNQVPEEEKDFEVVCVDKINDELRGVPVSNVIMDVEGKQLTFFNFILRNRLRAEAEMAMAQNMEDAQQNQDTQQ